MSEKTIEQRIKEIVTEQLGVDESKIVPEASFVNDLGADSLDTVELIMALEDAFSEELPDGVNEEEAEKLQTVGDLVSYIEKKLN